MFEKEWSKIIASLAHLGHVRSGRLLLTRAPVGYKHLLVSCRKVKNAIFFLFLAGRNQISISVVLVRELDAAFAGP